MNIVILDGYTTIQDDLTFDSIKQLGNTTIYDRTPKDKVVERSIEADILIVNKVLLTKDILSQLPKLKYIGLLSTGYNVVDLDYAKAHNIPVCNIPSYSTPSVAQITTALLLEIANNVGIHSNSVLKGDWTQSMDFCYIIKPQIELKGKTIGLIGYGSIGKSVALVMQALGLNVIAYRRSGGSDSIAKIVPLEELLSKSDIISLHCPIDSTNSQFINDVSIAKMKDSVILINTARGGLLDEQAVANALISGKIKALGVDVLSTEPPLENNPLLTSPNTFITPHIAWASYEARQRLINIATNNIKSFIEGNVTNCVY